MVSYFHHHQFWLVAATAVVVVVVLLLAATVFQFSGWKYTYYICTNWSIRQKFLRRREKKAMVNAFGRREKQTITSRYASLVSISFVARIHFVPFITHLNRHIAETFLETNQSWSLRIHFFCWFSCLSISLSDSLSLARSVDGILFKNLLSGKVASGTDRNHFNSNPIWTQTDGV